MKKKIITTLLLIIFILSSFVGCGSKKYSLNDSTAFKVERDEDNKDNSKKEKFKNDDNEIKRIENDKLSPGSVVSKDSLAVKPEELNILSITLEDDDNYANSEMTIEVKNDSKYDLDDVYLFYDIGEAESSFDLGYIEKGATGEESSYGPASFKANDCVLTCITYSYKDDENVHYRVSYDVKNKKCYTWKLMD